MSVNKRLSVALERLKRGSPEDRTVNSIASLEVTVREEVQNALVDGSAPQGWGRYLAGTPDDRAQVEREVTQAASGKPYSVEELLTAASAVSSGRAPQPAPDAQPDREKMDPERLSKLRASARRAAELPERLLQHWEEAMWYFRTVLREPVGRKAYPLIDPSAVPNPAGFRRHLLEDFGKPLDARFDGDKELGFLNHFPKFLKAWTDASRRVFHVDADTAELLKLTDSSRMFGTEVKLPFPAFVVTFSEPILFGKVRLAGVAVSELGSAVVTLQLPQDLVAFERTPLAERVKAEKKYAAGSMPPALGASHGREVKVRKGMSVQQINWSAPAAPDASVIAMGGGKRTLEEVGHDKLMAEYQEANGVVPGELGNFVANVVLYLASQGRNSVHVSKFYPKEPSGKPVRPADVAYASVADEASVCCVGGIGLSSMERAAIGGGEGREGVSPSAHFRKGHFRRAPGKAADPFAPKCVWVRPTLVRRDALPAGAVPVAVSQLLLPSK